MYEPNYYLEFGEYSNTHIKDIPYEYLFWLLPKIAHIKDLYDNFMTIFEYFISIGSHIYPGVSAFYFYLNDYSIEIPGGGLLPYLISYSKMINSKNINVYEIITSKGPMYIEEYQNKLLISNKYVSCGYKYGGQRMVYEKNDNFYFLDGTDMPYMKAYLMRHPYLPEDAKDKFSGNIKIN